MNEYNTRAIILLHQALQTEFDKTTTKLETIKELFYQTQSLDLRSEILELQKQELNKLKQINMQLDDLRTNHSDIIFKAPF